MPPKSEFGTQFSGLVGFICSFEHDVTPLRNGMLRFDLDTRECDIGLDPPKDIIDADGKNSTSMAEDSQR